MTDALLNAVYDSRDEWDLALKVMCLISEKRLAIRSLDELAGIIDDTAKGIGARASVHARVRARLTLAYLTQNPDSEKTLDSIQNPG